MEDNYCGRILFASDIYVKPNYEKIIINPKKYTSYEILSMFKKLIYTNAYEITMASSISL